MGDVIQMRRAVASAPDLPAEEAVGTEFRCTHCGATNTQPVGVVIDHCLLCGGQLSPIVQDSLFTSIRPESGGR